MTNEDVCAVKDVFKPRPKDGPQGEPPFWERFSGPKALLLLLCALLLGVAVGAALAVFFPLFQGRWVMPLQFFRHPRGWLWVYFLFLPLSCSMC